MLSFVWTSVLSLFFSLVPLLGVFPLFIMLIAIVRYHYLQHNWGRLSNATWKSANYRLGIQDIFQKNKIGWMKKAFSHSWLFLFLSVKKNVFSCKPIVMSGCVCMYVTVRCKITTHSISRTQWWWEPSFIEHELLRDLSSATDIEVHEFRWVPICFIEIVLGK